MADRDELKAALKHYLQESDGITVWMPSEVVKVLHAELNAPIQPVATQEDAGKVQAGQDFDAWQANPYTITLQKSIAEDYVPRTTENQHFDDHAVDCFAKMMKAKLAKKRADGRGGWDDPEQCSVEFLSQLLHEHVAKGDPVDVANLCMMIRHYDAPITAASQPSNAVHSVTSDDDALKYAIFAMSKVLEIAPLPTGNRIIFNRNADMLRNAIDELRALLTTANAGKEAK